MPPLQRIQLFPLNIHFPPPHLSAATLLRSISDSCLSLYFLGRSPACLPSPWPEPSTGSYIHPLTTFVKCEWHQPMVFRIKTIQRPPFCHLAVPVSWTSVPVPSGGRDSRTCYRHGAPMCLWPLDSVPWPRNSSHLANSSSFKTQLHSHLFSGCCPCSNRICQLALLCFVIPASLNDVSWYHEGRWGFLWKIITLLISEAPWGQEPCLLSELPCYFSFNTDCPNHCTGVRLIKYAHGRGEHWSIMWMN